MQSLNLEVLLHLTSNKSYNAKPWTGCTCTFAVLLFILITDQHSTSDPKESKPRAKERGQNSFRLPQKKFFERRFYPRVQMTSGQVCSEFNTNPHGPVSIPRTLRFESHIKHLILDFYRFRINENLSKKRGGGKRLCVYTNTHKHILALLCPLYHALWHSYVT